jgi:hypothetical protein
LRPASLSPSLAVWASSLASTGEEALMATMRDPYTVPSSKPPSPATNSSTSGGPGSMAMLMALFSASSLGESATDAPRATELFRLICGAIVDHFGPIP